MKKIICILSMIVLCSSFTVQAGTALNDIVVAGNTTMVLEGQALSELVGQTVSYGNITALVVNNDGTIVIGTDAGSIATLNKDVSGQLAWGPNLGGAVTSLAVQSNGNIVAGVAKSSGSYMIVDPNSQIIHTQSWLGNSLDAVHVAVLSDDRIVAVGEGNGRIWLAPAEPNSLIASHLYSDSKPVYSLAVQSDDTIIVGSGGLAGTEGWAWKLALDGDSFVRGNIQKYFGQGRVSVDVLSNDDVVVGTGSSGVVFVRDGANWAGLYSALTNEDIQDIAVTTDDKIAVTSNSNNGSVSLYEKDLTTTLALIAQATDLESNMKVVTWIPSLETCEDYWTAGIGNPADLSMNCSVGVEDLKMFVADWLTTYDKDSF